MAEQTTKSKNENLKIQDLVTLVGAGKIRIPEFQRSFRWDSDDVLALFDSILRGYPFGSLLLWKRSAPKAQLQVGALRIDAPTVPDALWVVDGQQRITSLVNGVDPVAGADDRFRIIYSLDQHRFVAQRDLKAALGIPLPNLFDLSRAFAWLQENPDAAPHAAEIQRVTALLRDVEVSASVIEEAEEKVLREVFDRINSAGKRLRGSEIFDAIHSETGSAGEQSFSVGAIADRLDQATDFGRLDDEIIYQAILVRRHPDVTRDAHIEFNSDRSSKNPFDDESKADAYAQTELSLERVIRFLQERAGIPHFTFVPFRFHLLVLTRFFALFDRPSSRNLELLSRWFWRSTASAGVLGYTGSTGNIRSLAALVEPGSESGSVQRLLDATNPGDPVPTPRLDRFRTNHSSAKVILAALWARAPIDPTTGRTLTYSDLAAYLSGESSPAAVALEVFPRRSLASEGSSAANRVIAVTDRDQFMNALTSSDSFLDVFLFDREMISAIDSNDLSKFISLRTARLESYLRDFLDDRTGAGFEVTPPLSDFDLDDRPDEDSSIFTDAT
ncbi:DUF262 domain-containing protein [Mycobacteroides abscessus]|uniref:DUF262 domain-containing protein n=1 Tax=Mycobacteroides abscessus TaxID=36809 RepID=UPI0009A89CE8|nr:DUF262 domain-containing protein [Mycobacteroides abscessus]MBN7496728.1 DUF262 domain-containing protein [Mycobacteroides abscessus subsp. abscessus]MDM2078813.1 DUF262 domain-containing protein [Mycobacteroides abscessus]MDM2084599.1 DUF262 domain-containing protein [Mycobacteroides abscessus]MDM3901836.1 DUF262 domain-containing protein [Mycobacteroides abscessus]RIU24630.1 DUF262 domain-containing protein [Mycobacteroides abscessus]